MSALRDTAEQSAVGAPRIRPLADLRANPLNPRGPVSAEDVADLAESIHALGVLQPLLVLPDGTVVAGHRRLAAARLAGVVAVPVIERDLSEREQIEAMTAENVARKDLSPSAEARAYRRLAALGLTHGDIARRVGVPPSRVAARLQVLELPAPVVEMIDRGAVPLGAVKALAELGDAGEVGRLAEALARRDVTVAALSDARKVIKLRDAMTRREAAPQAKRAVEHEPASEAHVPPGRSEQRGPCPHCADARGVAVAALASLRRAEDLIRSELGPRYVPARPAVLQGR
jgi:ParB family chromosome partitioning protein